MKPRPGLAGSAARPPVPAREAPRLTWVRGPAGARGGSGVTRSALSRRPALRWRCVCPAAVPLAFCLVKMAAALLLLRRRRRLRALGRRRRPLSLTERRGAGTRGAMAGGRRGAMARPEQSNSAPRDGTPSPNPRTFPSMLRGHRYRAPEPTSHARPPTQNPRRPLLHRFAPCSTDLVWW